MTHDAEQDDRNDRGLQYDLGTLRWQRRWVIQMVSGMALFALAEKEANLVYATAGYEQSVANMKQTPLSRDMVFSDGVSNQKPTITANVTDGFQAALVVGL